MKAQGVRRPIRISLFVFLYLFIQDWNKGGDRNRLPGTGFLNSNQSKSKPKHVLNLCRFLHFCSYPLVLNFLYFSFASNESLNVYFPIKINMYVQLYLDSCKISHWMIFFFGYAFEKTVNKKAHFQFSCSLPFHENPCTSFSAN